MNITEIKTYQSKDGRIKLEVRIEPESVWLSAEQMAHLFQKQKSLIEELIAELIKAKEVDPEKDELELNDEGLPGMTVSYWCLETIIAVGDRLQSSQTKPFRLWAAERILKATEQNETKKGWLAGILIGAFSIGLVSGVISIDKILSLQNGIWLLVISASIGLVNGILLTKKLKPKLVFNRKLKANFDKIQIYLVFAVTGFYLFVGLQVNNAFLEEAKENWYLVTEKSSETNSSDYYVTIEMNGENKKLKCGAFFYSKIIVGGKILISTQKSKIGFDYLQIKLGQTKSGFVSN